MKPLILQRAIPAKETPWRDAPTDTDPLPAAVVVAADGSSTSVATRVTNVRVETTDDQ